MALQHKKVLVTGASGFIGSALCGRLLALGAEVHGISRRVRESGSSGLRWWRGDIVEISAIREIVTAVQPEFIFHLGGHTQAARGQEQILPSFQTNLISTINLLLAANEVGCKRVLLTGSLEEPDMEDVSAASCTPSSPYAASKYAASCYARMFHSLYQLDVVVLRVFMVYGPAQSDLRKLVPSVILTLLKGESARLGSGQRLVDWIYVDDVAAGFVAAAEATGVAGKTIDIGSGELVSVRELVEQLAPLVDADSVIRLGALPDRPLEQIRAADLTPAKLLLGWKPTVTLAQGLRNTVEWYRTEISENRLAETLSTSEQPPQTRLVTDATQ